MPISPDFTRLDAGIQGMCCCCATVCMVVWVLAAWFDLHSWFALQVSNADALDAVFVAIGGGGLIAGVAAYIKALKPHIKIYGVEPTGANAMAMSLDKGHRITLSRVDAFADGVAVKQVGQETFRLCRQLVDGVVLVDNAAISAAIKDVFNETRNILEPAGAVAVAGAKAWLKKNSHKVSQRPCSLPACVV